MHKIRFILCCFAVLSGLKPLLRAGDKDLPWRPQAYKPIFTERERELPYVFARGFIFYDWPFLDGQWEGIIAAGDGNVYFSISSHAKRQHAQVFRYVADADRIEHLADLGHACGEMPVTSAPQDKIHSQMFEDGDTIFCGTCDGHSYQDLPYKGGYWLAIDKTTGRVRSLGKSISDDGLITVGYDKSNKLLYGLTNHKGRLLRFNPRTNEEKDLGFPWEGADAQWPRGLSLMITPDGRVYGGRPPKCSFWEYDPKTEKIRVFRPEMPDPENLDTKDKKALRDWKASSMHLTAWNEKDRCFYFVRSFDEALCRFAPPEKAGAGSGRVEVLRRLRPPGLPVRYDLRPAACVLSIHNRTVWYTPNTAWGGVTHLVSYNLDTKKWNHHGPIITAGGRRVNEVHSLDVGDGGRLYMVAFVFTIEGLDTERPYAMRDKYPFHPRFLIVNPATDLKPGTGKGNEK